MPDRKDHRHGAPRPLALGDWIEKLVPAPEPERDALAQALAGLLSAEHAAVARVIALRRGTATIEVESSCLLHELRTLRHDEILQVFRNAIGAIAIRRIAFRLASSFESR